jgi:ubiquinone/menaquinone biosynthesis C-methylase UbiE
MTRGHPQKAAFLDHEGDAWFQRNRAAVSGLTDTKALAVAMLEAYLQPGDALLEIGCANGVNLAHLAQRTGCRALGLDPSSASIEDGRSRWPFLELETGTADTLPWPEASVDMVWFGFCFYLVDRPLLMRVIAEADRVLKPEGCLALTDFDCDRPTRRPYAHLPGLSSFKMDYSALFTENPAYTLIEKVRHEPAGQPAHRDRQQRVATWLLRKSIRDAYHEEHP